MWGFSTEVVVFLLSPTLRLSRNQSGNSDLILFAEVRTNSLQRPSFLQTTWAFDSYLWSRCGTPQTRLSPFFYLVFAETGSQEQISVLAEDMMLIQDVIRLLLIISSFLSNGIILPGSWPKLRSSQNLVLGLIVLPCTAKQSQIRMLPPPCLKQAKIGVTGCCGWAQFVLNHFDNFFPTHLVWIWISFEFLLLSNRCFFL